VQYASPDFPGKNMVTIGKIDPKKGADQRFIADLLENKKPAEKFNVTSESSDATRAVLNLEPKNPSELKAIKITIDKKKKCIQEVSYKDDAENLTTIKLGEPKILDKEKGKDLFDYKPDTEKDQVTRT
jgi:outer membrane lipoprotein-sorting protein